MSAFHTSSSAAHTPHIVLLVATNRGLRFLQCVHELLPEARLTVFSFKEDAHEPPFLDAISSFTTSIPGGAFYQARSVGLPKYRALWAELGALDLMFCVSWRYLVPTEVYELPSRGAYVFHDSLLPRYRGFAPTVWSIVNGESTTGVSLMAIGRDVDSGDVVDQEAVGIGPDDTIKEVLERVTLAYLRVLQRNFPSLLDGTRTLLSQDHSRATFTCKRTPRDNELHWRRPARDCYNLVRAICRPYPGAIAFCDGRSYLVWGADLRDSRLFESDCPGRVAGIVAGESVSVMCGDRRPLRLTHLEDEDGKQLTGTELTSRFRLSSSFEVCRCRHDR